MNRQPWLRAVSFILCAAGATLGGCGSKQALVALGQDAGPTPGTTDAAATPGMVDAGTAPGLDGQSGVGSASDGAVVANDPRGQAATATANGNASCVSIQPFYWEIGNRDGKLVGGTASQAGASDGRRKAPQLLHRYAAGSETKPARNGLRWT